MPKDVPQDILQKPVSPIRLEIEGLPSDLIEPEEIEGLPSEHVEPEVVTTVTKRTVTVVQAVQQEIEEIPTEIVRDITIEEVEVPFEVTVEEEASPKVPFPEEITQTVKVAPKPKKPTSPWEAPEDFEVVFEKVIETKPSTMERLKPDEVPEEKVETLPTHATSTAQLALYETTKPTVTMTFKVPEEAKEGIDENARHGAMDFALDC